jgi:hypothetical protein
MPQTAGRIKHHLLEMDRSGPRLTEMAHPLRETTVMEIERGLERKPNFHQEAVIEDGLVHTTKGNLTDTALANGVYVPKVQDSVKYTALSQSATHLHILRFRHGI